MNAALFSSDVIKGCQYKVCIETTMFKNKTELDIHIFNCMSKLLNQLSDVDKSYDVIIFDLTEQTAKYIPKIREINMDVRLLLIVNNTELLYNLFKYNISGFIQVNDVNDYLGSVVMQILNTSIKQDERYLPFDIILPSGIHYKQKILIFDILYIDVKEKTIKLHTDTDTFILKDHGFFIISQKMSELGFVHIDRSHIVNISRINRISIKELILDNGEKLYISRRKQKNVEQAFINQFYKRKEGIV